MKKILLILVSTVSFIAAQGSNEKLIQQQYQFKNLSVDDGLSNGRVQTIIQDSLGFIWLGNRRGVSKYDGYTIRNYTQYLHNDSLDNISSINELIIDREGRLWAACSEGLLFYNIDKDLFESYQHDKFDLELPTINTVKVDKENTLWFSLSDKLINLTPSSGRYQIYTPKKNNGQIIDDLIRTCYIDNRGNIWLTFARNGCGYFNSKDFTFRHFPYLAEDPHSVCDNDILSIYEDWEGNIWLGGNDNGLSIYDRDLEHFINYFPDSTEHASGRIRAIVRDPAGRYWLGTKAGLYKLDTTDWTFNKYAHADHLFSTLSHNSVQCIYIDNQENMWIGTYAGGACYTSLNRNGFFHYKHNRIRNEYFLCQKDINCFAEDREGNLWIGTESGGLNHFNRQTGVFTHYLAEEGNQKALQSNSIKALAVTPENNLWIGTYGGGLSYFDNESKIFTTYLPGSQELPGLAGNRVYSLLYDSNRNLWISGANELQVLLKGNSEILTFSTETPGYINSREFGHIVSMMQDNRGWIWLAGNRGLDMYKPEEKTFISYTNFEDFDLNYVYHVASDNQGYIWFNVKIGEFIRLDPVTNSYIRYDETKNAPAVNYHAFISDNLGNLWVTSDNGLFKFKNLILNPDTLDYTVYKKSDGLQSKFFYRGAALKSNTGEIFIGGINGFNGFDPKTIMDNPFPPEVVITGLKINNKPITVNEKVGGRKILEKSLLVTKKIVFNSKVKVFSFELAGIHFVSPDKNGYQYIMEGYDDDWVTTTAGRRIVTYSNLPAGKYIFKVKASNNNGIWNETPVELYIKVRPPIYKSKIFVVLVVILLIGIIYLGVKVRERQLKADKNRLHAELAAGEEQLKKQKKEIEQQKEEIKIRDEQEKEIRWLNTGLAKFSDIISKNKQSFDKLSQAIITNLVEYTESNQGAIFLLNDNDPEDYSLEFSAGYALDTSNNERKVFKPGEGLIGTCYTEKKIIEIDDVPKDYLKISSGLGELAPKHIVLVPMRFDDKVVGVIELGSFKKLEKFKHELIDKVGESATSILSIIRSEQQAREAMENAKQHSEELQSSEEELRQNMEELTSTQEELYRKQEGFLTEQLMFQTLMNFLDDRVTFKDPESVYLRINKIKADALKLADPKDAIGKSDKDFFGEEHFKRSYKQEKEIFEKGRSILNEEELIRFTDRTVRWGSTSRVPYKSSDGKRAGTLIITKDVTNLKMLESENKGNQEILQLIARECPVILYTLDHELKVVKASGKGFDLLGFDNKRLVGLHVAKLFKFPKDKFDADAKSQLIKYNLKVGNKKIPVEHKVVFNQSTEGYFGCAVVG